MTRQSEQDKEQDNYSVARHRIGVNGPFPNNAAIDLRILRQPLAGPVDAGTFEERFDANGWPPAWRGPIFDYDHYHSTAHEVLGCYQGRAELQFGGPGGIAVQLQAGDVVIIPAGVAHRCLASAQFMCVGAYPAGQTWDTCLGDIDKRAAAQERIRALGAWTQDPI